MGRDFERLRRDQQTVVCPERVHPEEHGVFPHGKAWSHGHQCGQAALSIHGMGQSCFSWLQVRHTDAGKMLHSQPVLQCTGEEYVVPLSFSYPQAVMDKITEMGEGIVVVDAPVHRTTADGAMAKGKRSALAETDADSCVKRAKCGPNELAGRPTGRTSTRPLGQKSGPPPQAPAEHQPFFNRLYKAVAWKLVSAGGFGPNLDHFEILRSCVESCKQTLSCVFVPLKDITGLPAGRTQEGHVCEIRCQTVYMGTGYGRDESAAKAMASKEALKVFQGRKVTVKICRRRYKGRDVEDLMLLDEQPRNQGFPPALSYPFHVEDGSS
ncbi:uncharacterized protein V6R79_016529 [Siganus canaliculatus]